MNKIEKCQRSITESLIEIYLTEIVEDGKNKAIFKELEKDEARELITLMIYDRIQKPLSFKPLLEIIEEGDMDAVIGQLLQLSNTVHHLEKELYSIHRAIFSSDKDKLLYIALDNFPANVADEKMILLKMIEEVVEELEI